MDVEADAYVKGDVENEEGHSLIERAEKTELTPVEAFRWNVDGDQSPCEWPMEDN